MGGLYLNVRGRCADATHMTFAQHLDRLMNVRPMPTGDVLPDDPYAEWFVHARTQEPVTGVPTPPSTPYANHACNAPVIEVVEAPAPCEAAVLHLWTEVQEDALDDLRSLGAQLTADPTLAEVRTQWRRLARSLHPDAAGAHADAGRFSLAAEAWSVLRSGPVAITDDGEFSAGLR